MRQAVAWLNERVQLGRDVFARGVAEATDRAGGRRGGPVPGVPSRTAGARPSRELHAGRPPLWRVADASAGIMRLLSADLAGEIALFMPPLPPEVSCAAELHCAGQYAGRCAGTRAQRGAPVEHR